MAAPEADAPTDLGLAVAKIPSGVAILTAADGPVSTGMLASWYQQASFTPLMLTAAIKRGRPVVQLIETTKRFALNILGEDDKRLMQHFARGFALTDEAFTGINLSRRDDYVVLADVLAFAACEVRAVLPAGDHLVYLAEVVEGGLRGDGQPLVHLRKNALNY